MAKTSDVVKNKVAAEIWDAMVTVYNINSSIRPLLSDDELGKCDKQLDKALEWLMKAYHTVGGKN